VQLGTRREAHFDRHGIAIEGDLLEAEALLSIKTNGLWHGLDALILQVDAFAREGDLNIVVLGLVLGRIE
jgi:hypothetical protein